MYGGGRAQASGGSQRPSKNGMAQHKIISMERCGLLRVFLAAAVLLVPACGGVTIINFPGSPPSGPPGPFGLHSPSTGATVSTTQPTFLWNVSPNAASYSLQIATDNLFANIVVDQSSIAGTWAIPAAALTNSQSYWWRVIAVNAIGSTFSTGAPWSFTIDAVTFSFLPQDLAFTANEGGADPADQSISMTDTGGLGSGVTWTAASDQPWLTVSPPSGSSAPSQTTPLTVHVNATYQGEAWTGSTSTTGAPSMGYGAWIGNALLIWSGDAATPGKFYDPVSDTWSGSATTVNAPSNRTDFSAVWTGTEMIVWGGLSSGTPLNTGARYNPASDTWTTMSTVGAPSARFAHRAVWTGTRMIAWGGEQPGFNYNNTGGIYDPASDTWVGATTTTNAPSPRGFFAAVWTGASMLLWGGEDPSKFNQGYLYDPVPNAWIGSINPIGAPAARSHMPGAWTGRELIVWGGGSGGPHLNTGARYNPASNRWSGPLPLAGAPAGRANFVAAWTGSRMIVWGGEINGPLTNTGGIYRPPIPAFGVHSATITVSATGPGGVTTQTFPVQLTVN